MSSGGETTGTKHADELAKVREAWQYTVDPAPGDRNRLRIVKILQRKEGAGVCEIQYILSKG
jgi:DNA-binding transcriptional ArsR family regulator